VEPAAHVAPDRLAASDTARIRPQLEREIAQALADFQSDGAVRGPVSTWIISALAAPAA
jgi:hypothetical protein